MSEPAVSYAGEGPVARITISRPERLNRLDTDIVDGLHQAWARFMDTEAHRVALLAGAGDRAFTAGADASQRWLFQVAPRSTGDEMKAQCGSQRGSGSLRESTSTDLGRWFRPVHFDPPSLELTDRF